jgi:hypothetical protein
MRILILSLVLCAGVPALSACTSPNANAPAVQAMDDQANSCGQGGSSNINDCNNGAGRR